MPQARRRWIQKALRVGRHRRRVNGVALRVGPLHKGALHRMLGIPEDETIPLALLREAAAYPERFYDRADLRQLLRRRARLALIVRGLGRGRSKFGA